jgi:hypothetical protein
MRGGADPAAFVLVTFAVLSVVVILWALTLRFRRRELQHKERMAAIEKGAPLPDLTDVDQTASWTPRVYLLRGMMWLFSGIGLMLFLGAVSVSASRIRSVEDRIYAAQRLKERGGTDEQVRAVQNDMTPRDNLPPGFSLIALVPIGVGLAYLLSYRVESKRHDIRLP